MVDDKMFSQVVNTFGAFNAKVKQKETWGLEKWRGKIGGGRDGKGEEKEGKVLYQT